ncbi:beta-galactosidase [Dactylosporangium matsuzakiense]|uniref:Beta-galactosidase n=1 Tax=Dactylosporangium matsuzakiense TaxID=53360 RepID=A0A9W6KQT2_9ACTN|nr:beta-galactosidase [Dactylosporangium matsuzakiense]UWZ48616.1 beta-galactosidase [Dactylosporangium matsuzakiense]GLL06451.1 beta-galactosidase [Dactylosporangium matsuzakiense]
MNARMAAFRERLGGFAFGGDYNPEQWDPAVWKEDVELMRRAGVNLVTVGVFAWASLEPSPGEFTFGWLDDVLDLLHAAGISVDLATPTTAPPVWLSHGHPDVLPVMEDGETFGFGNRLHFDPTSPRYRSHAVRIADRLASRYSQHPALAMWHISNEYGPTSYGPHAAAAFRVWLRRRYADLDALNDAWYTRFWGQRYTDWEQVAPPEVPRSWSNPARRLDFKRFISDALLECFIAERDAVRRYRDDIPILTNFMRFYRHADYWRWAPHEDAAALDIYPDPGRPGSHVSAALNFDLMRSLRGEPWVLMEQAASAVSQWKVNNVKRPGRMRLGSYQAIAHGADSVLFFQWRAGRGGHERFHSAMLPHSGPAARTFLEVAALGNELPLIAAVAGAPSSADVAVLFDWDAWWGLEVTHGLPRNDFDYTAIVESAYRPLFEAHYAVDLVSFGSDLSRYRILVVPNAYLVDDGFVAAVEEFAAAGGTVVVSFFSGVVDVNNQVRQPAYPGAFRRLIGAYIDEYWPAREGETFEVEFADGTTAIADWWQESLHPETATVLGTYTTGDLAGRPALIRNDHGSGCVVYIGTRLEPAALRDTLLSAVRAAGAAPVVEGAPPYVEAARRDRYLFLLNHSDARAATVTVPGPGRDLLTGAAVTDAVDLPPLGVAVVELS